MQEKDTVSSKTTIYRNSMMSILGNLCTVIVSPIKTIKRTSSNIKIILLFPIIILTAELPYLIRYDFLRNSIINTVNNSNISLRDMTSSINGIITYNMVSLPTITLIGFLFWPMIIFVIAKLMHGEGSLKQYIVIYGYTISIHFLLVCSSIVASYFTGKPVFDISLHGLFNLNGNSGDAFFGGFLKMIEPFKIWKYFIILEGLLHIGKLSKVKALSIILIIFLMAGMIQGVGDLLQQITSQLK